MARFFRSLFTVGVVVGLGILCVAVFSLAVTDYFNQNRSSTMVNGDVLENFPVSVNPRTKQIVENPIIDWYVGEHLSLVTSDKRRKLGVVERVIARLAELSLYQQLAAPLSRNLVIYPGERKEEVVKHFGDVLDWSTKERDEFSTLVTSANPSFPEGKFYPGSYTVNKDATPSEVADLLLLKFSTEILNRYDATLEEIVPLHDTLVIASLLEREAYDFADMRYISGIIWNRLFAGMPLQIDATLQYAKGSQATSRKWWPVVRPVDKYIDSTFNTYKYKGLPPEPISNPSLEAVIAALNPHVTDCMFYFHDTEGNFYCSVTYAEHVAKLKSIFGQGK